MNFLRRAVTFCGRPSLQHTLKETRVAQNPYHSRNVKLNSRIAQVNVWLYLATDFQTYTGEGQPLLQFLCGSKTLGSLRTEEARHSQCLLVFFIGLTS